MGYSVYFWGELSFPGGKIGFWRNHKPDAAKWKDWNADFAGDDDLPERPARTAEELCGVFPVHEKRELGYFSRTLSEDKAELHGCYDESEFSSHARSLAVMFRSAADFGAEGTLSYLTDEYAACLLHVEKGKSWFEKVLSGELDDQGYRKICAELEKGKEKPGKKTKSAMKKTSAAGGGVEAFLADFRLMKSGPAKVFEKFGRLPAKTADDKTVEDFRETLSNAGGVAEIVFDGGRRAAECADLFAAEPRWFDLGMEALKDERFREDAFALIKYHPTGFAYIVKNYKKFPEKALNAFYDCYINGPAGKIPMSLLDPLLPLMKKDKELALFMEKAQRRAEKRKGRK